MNRPITFGHLFKLFLALAIIFGLGSSVWGIYNLGYREAIEEREWSIYDQSCYESFYFTGDEAPSGAPIEQIYLSCKGMDGIFLQKSEATSTVGTTGSMGGWGGQTLIVSPN